MLKVARSPIRLTTALKVLVALYCADGIIRKGWLQSKVELFSMRDDERMQRILSKTETIRSHYRPTFWAHGTYMQLALLLFWKAWHKGSVAFERHVVKCEDGGEVAVEIMEDSKALPATAPIVLILHTITGSAEDESEFVKYAFKKGWRPIVLSRRGHFDGLKTPKFNMMGCTNDTKKMVEYVKELFPQSSFIGAVGFSAGSGQVVSYIGRQNDVGPVHCAVSLCPAYDISQAFDYFHEHSPFLARYLLDGLKRYFLKRNEHVFSEDMQGYEAALASQSIGELFERHAPIAGFPCINTYMEDSNPMNHYHNSKIPCLLLNARDDPLCLEKNIRYDICEKTPNFALAITSSGSHVAYREGLLGETSFMHRVAMDFIEASYDVEMSQR